MRGINTFNLFKRVIWSCVTHRPNSGGLNRHSKVNLPLLKGLLNEIKGEIYITDILQRRHGDETAYKKIDIKSDEGFNDFTVISDHESIEKKVSQITLIDPFTMMKAFGADS